VDTVHQGEHDGQAGVYHLNAVDTVTQWEVVGCTETISERHLIPVLEAMLHQFPFRILGFHGDNGSEFLNYKVVDLLNKLLVEEFTKSRAYRTTDNAQVDGKNGAGARTGVGEHFKRPRGELHPMVFGRQQAGEKTEDEEARHVFSFSRGGWAGAAVARPTAIRIEFRCADLLY
jgi:hypothetical protein